MLQFVLYGILRTLKAAIRGVLGGVIAILALALLVWLAYGSGPGIHGE